MKTIKSALFTRVAASLLMLCGAGMASAATITITPSSTTVAPGSTFTVVLGYTSDNATTNFNLVMNYDTTLADATATSTAGSPFPNTCAQNDALGRVAVVTTSGTGQPLGAGNFCTVSFTATGAAGTTINFTLSNTNFTGSPGGDTLGTASVMIANTPVQRTLAFNPTAGSTISLTGGTGAVGSQTVAQDIVVTSTGNSGTPSVSGCAITGPGAAQFTVTPTSLTGFDVDATQELSVNCTRQAAVATATLTCNETDADSTNTPRAFNLSCPAGAVVPVNPTITASPASGSTITINGVVGTTGTSAIDFTATGGMGSGSTTINCSSTGTVLLTNAPGTPNGTTANQTVTGSAAALDVIVGVNLTNAAQTPAGTVTCTVTPNGGVATVLTYTVNATAGVVQTAVIVPANDLWSKIALFGLLATLGALVIGFRRQH